jgi:hypothetical protein
VFQSNSPCIGQPCHAAPNQHKQNRFGAHVGEYQKLSYGSQILHGVLIHKNISIPLQKNPGIPDTMLYLAGQREDL